MNKINARWFILTMVLLGVVVAWDSGCIGNKAPSTLSPVATAQFYKTRVVKSLDVVRDTAVDANALVPPLVSTPTTRTVVKWHESTLKVIDASAAGWQTAVSTSLDELLKDLPAGDAKVIQPYVALAKTVLQEVQ